MPACMLKRFVPFMLTLVVGLVLGSLFRWPQFVTRPGIHYTRTTTSTRITRYETSASQPLTIVSVPMLEFTEAARRGGWFSGQVHLTALFDSDGTVRDVKPALIIPYGMTVKEYVALHGEQPTPARLNYKAVETLPYGLTEALIEAVKAIEFTPALRDGRPVAVQLTIHAEYQFTDSPDCDGCSSVNMTIMDVNGVKWKRRSLL